MGSQSFLFHQLFFPPSVFVRWGLSQWQGNALSGDSCLWLVGLTPWAKLHRHWSCNHPCPCAHDSYSYCQGIYSCCLSEKDAVFDFSSSCCGSGIHSRDFLCWTCNIVLLAQHEQIVDVRQVKMQMWYETNCCVKCFNALVCLNQLNLTASYLHDFCSSLHSYPHDQMGHSRIKSGHTGTCSLIRLISSWWAVSSLSKYSRLLTEQGGGSKWERAYSACC